MFFLIYVFIIPAEILFLLVEILTLGNLIRKYNVIGIYRNFRQYREMILLIRSNLYKDDRI
jgi:hypothetical protein